MRPRKFVETLTFKLSKNQRQAIESLADREALSLGEAARMLLEAGMRTKGIV